MAGDGLAGGPDRLLRLLVGGDRFRDDLVDDTEPRQIGRGDAHRLGGFGRAPRVFPEDGRAGFRRSHGVDGVLEHQNAIGDADGQRATRSALADDDGDRRHAKVRHGQQALGDRRRLTALLRADARFGPGGVDKGDQRKSELLGVSHQPFRFAVSLRPGHAEVAGDVLLGVVALLMPEDHHRLTVERRQPADQGEIVAERAVAVELDPVGHQRVEIVQGMRPLGVAGQLDALPGRHGASPGGAGNGGCLSHRRPPLARGATEESAASASCGTCCGGRA